jgi:hypothetical protein
MSGLGSLPFFASAGTDLHGRLRRFEAVAFTALAVLQQIHPIDNGHENVRLAATSIGCAL